MKPKENETSAPKGAPKRPQGALQRALDVFKAASTAASKTSVALVAAALRLGPVLAAWDASSAAPEKAADRPTTVGLPGSTYRAVRAVGRAMASGKQPDAEAKESIRALYKWGGCTAPRSGRGGGEKPPTSRSLTAERLMAIMAHAVAAMGRPIGALQRAGAKQLSQAVVDMTTATVGLLVVVSAVDPDVATSATEAAGVAVAKVAATIDRVTVRLKRAAGQKAKAEGPDATASSSSDEADDAAKADAAALAAEARAVRRPRRRAA